MAFLKTLAILIMLPLIGYGVSAWVIKDYNSTIRDALGEDVSVSQLCDPSVLSEMNDSELYSA